MFRSESEKCPSRRAWAEVDLSAIRDNIAAIRAQSNANILAVVKADAYGHGMLPVSKAALEAGAEWLGVATADEGIFLREAGIKAAIALLCHPAPDEAEAVLAFKITPTVGDWETLEAFAAASRRREETEKSAIHLEIDTGIGRSGILPEQAVSFWRRAVESGLNVTGLATHLADPDAEESPFGTAQIALFENTRRMLEASGARFDWIHAGSSAAVLRFPRQSGNLLRPGLLLYGLRPGVSQTISLRPALALKARVATVRELPAGHNISYGLTCALTRPSRVATVLIGYGDGYPRRLSNSGHVLLHGRPAPILGRVCMDQTVVDVTDIPEAKAGDTAVCIGRLGDAQIAPSRSPPISEQPNTKSLPA